jgi:hypothetical protein
MAGVGKVWVGPIPSDVCGRTDHLPINVPAGCYVFPADIVSGFGEGNTIAGFKAINNFLGKQKYLGGETTEVLVAGGEYIVTPQTVSQKIGGGDLNKGHEVMDGAVVKYRKKTIKTLQNLPGPKK